MLQIVLWKWDQPGAKNVYLPDHVDIMCSMLRRNLKGLPHRIVCVTDNDAGIHECETAHLWRDFDDLPNASGKQLPSCYRRLKLYDRETQKDIGIDKGDRIVGIDLDTLICGDVRKVFQTEGVYVGWQLKNYLDRYVFNGSLQIFTAGTLQVIWDEFDPLTSPKKALDNGFRGSDQAWLSYKLIGEDGCIGLDWPVISSYPLHNRIQGSLKAETKIIFFHGSEKPWNPNAQFHTPWITRYWRT